MVSLGIHSDDYHVLPAIPIVDEAIWYPEIPDPKFSFFGISTHDLTWDDAGKHQRPLTMLLFGGVNGEILRFITHLTVFTQQRHGVMGIQIRYDRLVNGHYSALLGSSTPCRPTDFWRWQQPAPSILHKTEMGISAVHGEKIVSMEIDQDSLVFGFKVSFSVPCNAALAMTNGLPLRCIRITDVLFNSQRHKTVMTIRSMELVIINVVFLLLRQRVRKLLDSLLEL